MKKFIFGSIFIIAGILGFLYYVLQRHQQPIDSVFKAIPLDASIIIDIKDYNSFRNNLDNENALWNSLSQVLFFSEIEAQMHLFDSLKTKFPEIKNLIQGNPQIVISFHPLGKENLVPVYYCKLNSVGGFRTIAEIAENNTGTDITERNYEGETILDIILPGSGGKMSITYVKGLMILSSSAILVENVIRQISALESVIQKNGLGELIKTAGINSPANFYILNKAIPDFIADAVRARYTKDLKFIAKSGGWTELDFNIYDDLFVFSGFTIPGADTVMLTRMFSEQKPQKMELLSIIPNDAVLVKAIGISDFPKFRLEHQKFLESINQFNSLKNRRDSTHAKIDSDIFSDFNSIFDKEGALVITPGILDSLETCSFAVFRISNQDETDKIINTWIEGLAANLNIKTNELINEIKYQSDNKLNVFYLPNTNIPAALFGNMFNISKNEYCTIYENYLLFGPSEMALTDYIEYISNNTVLANDPDFKNISDNFSSASHFFFYLKPNISVDFYKNFFNAGITDEISLKMANINNIGALVYQFNASDKAMLYNNVIIKRASELSVAKPKTVWETKLDSRLLLKPVVLKNNKTGETEIFVQDDKNTVYLLNNSGRILWRLYLEEPVISNVYAIDYYRNRKLQYLFNTATKLYLVDRTGSYVENYPLKFKVPATNGISVFDYNNNRKYRIFYANRNREIILLNKEGQSEKGWDFGKTKGIVTQPIWHFEVNNSDYIVFKDNVQIYFVNRKGEEKFKTQHQIATSANNPVFLVSNGKKNKPFFVVTDTLGKIYQINVKGEISVIDLGTFPANHYFEARDIDNDKNSDYIFANGSNIRGYSQNSKEIFSYKVPYTITCKPEFIKKTDGQEEIALIAQNNEKVYVYDTSGNTVKGFPIKGSIQFSVLLLNNSEIRYNLIVGTNNNFLLNYSVQ